MTGRTPAELRDALRAALPTDPVQYDQPSRELVYVPRRHGAALNVNDMLVVGERGTGKSFWAKALTDPAILETARRFVGSDGLPGGVQVIRGWDSREGVADECPTRRELEQLVGTFAPRDIWASVYLSAIGSDVLPAGKWQEKVRALEADPTTFSRAIRTAQRKQEASGTFVVVLFDELDRTADDPELRIKLLRGLLQLLLDLRATRFLRAKVFVRPDMIETSEARSFPDASKVVGNPARLDWEPTDLFALAWHRLANSDSHGAIFRDFARREVKAKFAHVENVYQIDEPLRADPGVQRELFHALTGPAMGPNIKRGIPYVWLPGHLADARKIVTVRSFLIALGQASQDDAHPGHQYALHWDALKDGVRAASQRRRQELEEDLPWAAEALNALEGLEIPCHFSAVQSRWTERGTVDKVRRAERPPVLELGHEERSLAKALEAAGVFETRSDRRLNVPDVYRVAYGLPLRGGVPTRRPEAR